LAGLFLLTCKQKAMTEFQKLKIQFAKEKAELIEKAKTMQPIEIPDTKDLEERLKLINPNPIIVPKSLQPFLALLKLEQEINNSKKSITSLFNPSARR
jgi:hypothetical protein